MKKIYQTSVKVREHRVEDCFYSWYFNSEEQAKEMVEKIKKGVVPLEDLNANDIEDVEVVESEVELVFTDEMDVQEIVIEEEYPFVVTENGVVTEYVPSMRLSLILERLKEIYDSLDEELKELSNWEDIRKGLFIKTFDRYGDRVVYQAIKN